MPGETLDDPRERGERIGVAAGVVVALRHAKRSQRGALALREVVEKSLIAAFGVVVVFRLEVDVAGSHPRALGDLGGRIGRHQLLPPVDGVAGVLEAVVAESRLVEREEALRSVRGSG